jgi:hypothetical protein
MRARDARAVASVGQPPSVKTDTPSRPCPHCGSTEAVRIVYGLPTAEAFEAAQRGGIALGGCLVGDESPGFECRNCHAPLPWVHVGDDD